MKLQDTEATQSSVVVERCQVCECPDLEAILFLGYLPPVNLMPPIGRVPREQAAYPAQWLRCPRCELLQLGLIVRPSILFPPEYPYRSGTTRILRENFAELYREVQTIIPLGSRDLVVDIGSNDGTLLSNFLAGGHRVQGIEPTLMGELAKEANIPTLIAFFGPEAAATIRAQQGPAKIVTATNVFAHMEDIHGFLETLTSVLSEDGMFISESHYLMSLIEMLQYDTIYHEHLRYYSLWSLKYLLEVHGFRVVHAKWIPTHGGSIRVYATRSPAYDVQDSVVVLLAEEERLKLDRRKLVEFRERVVMSKLQLLGLLSEIKRPGHRVFGVGAPSRATTLINYVGLDDGILDCVVEVKGSPKIGKYVPGTLIPVVEESRLFQEQPEYALLLSWHIGDELVSKLVERGYGGKFIVPLPVPKVVEPVHCG